MRNMRTSLLTFLFIAALSPFFLTCAPSGGDATVNINLGFPHDASNSSVIDSILSLFVNRAYAQPPDNIDQIIVRAEGPGMLTMDFVFTPDTTTATVVVPAGSPRKFTVLAYTPSATLGGSVEMNLEPGDNVSVTITMGLYSTKIVIPDYYRNRVVQIDNMNGTESEINATFVATAFGLASFQPRDIDFDSRGRIYIAARHGTISAVNQVIRVNDINDTPYTGFTDAGVTIYALAIDRKNSLVYYATMSQLFRSDYDGGSLFSGFNLGIMQTIRGLAVDDDGILYVSGANISGQERIFKYDPSGTGSVITDSGVALTLNTAFDVIVKSSYVYVANYGIAKKVIQLDKNLLFQDELTLDPDNPTDTFLGPHRFVAILNNRFYVIDEDETDMVNDNERIVAFDNINGGNWKTYRNSGDIFNFFGMC